jgi:hypothetical protein
MIEHYTPAAGRALVQGYYVRCRHRDVLYLLVKYKRFTCYKIPSGFPAHRSLAIVVLHQDLLFPLSGGKGGKGINVGRGQIKSLPPANRREAIS